MATSRPTHERTFRDRECVDCGRKFNGSGQSKYCLDCKVERMANGGAKPKARTA